MPSYEEEFVNKLISMHQNVNIINK